MINELEFPDDLNILSDPSKIGTYNEVVNAESKSNLFHHSILVKIKNWRSAFCSAEVINKEIFSAITVLKHNYIQDATIEIYISLIDKDVNPTDWVAIYRNDRYKEVIKNKSTKYSYGITSDTLSRYSINNQKYILRSKNYKDDNRVFLVECSCPERSYDELSEEFFIALASFKMISLKNKYYVEDLQKIFCKNPLVFYFNFPSSWSKKHKIINKSANLEILLERPSATLENLIYLVVCQSEKTKSISKMAEQHLSNLSSLGFRISGAHLEPVAANRFSKAYFANHYAIRKNIKYQSPFLIIEYGSANFLINLISIVRELSPIEWAINKRTFEIVRDTLKVE